MVGNCMQAAIASLLELPLESVPHFKIDEKYRDTGGMIHWLHENGYEFEGTLSNYNLYKDSSLNIRKDRFPEIKKIFGVKGFFYAVVYSPLYYKKGKKEKTRHAVLIDRNFNIVHPVNKAYDGLKQFPEAEALGYNGITEILMIKKRRGKRKK